MNGEINKVSKQLKISRSIRRENQQLIHNIAINLTCEYSNLNQRCLKRT